ncbi:hypothetical protein QJQ45_013011 [Haematococcus lacustris]|nr:hypothetical protein QJQ45_013011 [Haematococcus lacustris]
MLGCDTTHAARVFQRLDALASKSHELCVAMGVAAEEMIAARQANLLRRVERLEQALAPCPSASPSVPNSNQSRALGQGPKQQQQQQQQQREDQEQQQQEQQQLVSPDLHPGAEDSVLQHTSPTHRRLHQELLARGFTTFSFMQGPF